MFTYSTCRGCGDPMIVTDELAYQSGRHVHDGCPVPPPDRVSDLVNRFMAAAVAGESCMADELEQQVAQLQGGPPRLGEAALLYASWGWAVFPLAARSKVPAVKGGRGVYGATTDAARIRQHWGTHPDHNIGLAAGHRFDVIDIDRAGGGIDTYHRWLDIAADTSDNRGPLPDCHGKVATASGGLHIYVEPWAAQRNAVRLAPGVDVRSRGGYVVAPPSTLGVGKSWNWLTHPSPTIKEGRLHGNRWAATAPLHTTRCGARSADHHHI